MTPIEQELCAEISRAVERIVAASHCAATKALDQAFGRGLGEPRAGDATKRRRKPRRSAARRTKEELAELEKQLSRAICDMPGQSMAVLAEQLGATPRELHRPAAQLKSEGLVKTVGQRQFMRYFPRSPRAAEPRS